MSRKMLRPESLCSWIWPEDFNSTVRSASKAIYMYIAAVENEKIHPRVLLLKIKCMPISTPNVPKIESHQILHPKCPYVFLLYASVKNIGGPIAKGLPS